MKKALIDGSRVAQVVLLGSEFPVTSSLVWVDCPDNIIADKFVYKDGVFTENIQVVIPIIKLLADKLSTVLIKKLLITQAEIDAEV